MGKLQKEALIAYDKIKAERGDVTFIDVFVAGYEQATQEAIKWLKHSFYHGMWIANDVGEPERKVIVEYFEKYMKGEDKI